MMRFLRSKRGTAVTYPMLAALAGVTVVLVILGGFAFLMTKIDIGAAATGAMSCAALAAGAFTGGYVSAKKRRHSGLLTGVLCGVFMFILILIVTAVFTKAAHRASPSLKLVLTLIFAGAGGVAGVNSRN